LVLGKVVELEEIEVEEADIEAEIDRLVTSFQSDADKESARKVFDNPVGRQRIKLDLISDKAIERLMAIAKGEADKIVESPEESVEGGEMSKDEPEQDSDGDVEESPEESVEGDELSKDEPEQDSDGDVEESPEESVESGETSKDEPEQDSDGDKE
jgi:hypothetical protein